jgi:hypothetical protein
MALTPQEQNFVSRLQIEAMQLLETRDRLRLEVALYNAEGFGAAITDESLAALPALAHLTQVEVQNCLTAFGAVLTALGDDVSGQAVNLIRMRG